MQLGSRDTSHLDENKTTHHYDSRLATHHQHCLTQFVILKKISFRLASSLYTIGYLISASTPGDETCPFVQFGDQIATIAGTAGPAASRKSKKTTQPITEYHTFPIH